MTESVFAVAQLQSGDDLNENLATCVRLIARAKARGASFCGLPENFAFFGPERERRDVAEPADGSGPILGTLRAAAVEHRIAVLAGGFPERSPDVERPHNTAVLISPDGALSRPYRKIHLFDVEVGDGASYQESRATFAGDEVVVVDLPPFKLGLSICYDLRFPELYRKLIDHGANLLAVPAAFTLATGKDHWLALLRARAIESQSYVVAPAQCGAHPGNRRTFGKSCIVDPWGDVVAQAAEGEGIAVATLDLAYLEQVRSRLPSLRHRRAF